MAEQLTTQVTASTEVARVPTVVTWNQATLTAGSVAAAIVAIAALVALIHKALTKEVKRDVADVKNDVAEVRRDIAKVDHRIKGEAGRINALEHFRTGDIERIVRLETSLSNSEKALERIERGQKDHFDQLAQSIREIRVVAPRA